MPDRWFLQTKKQRDNLAWTLAWNRFPPDLSQSFKVVVVWGESSIAIEAGRSARGQPNHVGRGLSRAADHSVGGAHLGAIHSHPIPSPFIATSARPSCQPRFPVPPRRYATSSDPVPRPFICIELLELQSSVNPPPCSLPLRTLSRLVLPPWLVAYPHTNHWRSCRRGLPCPPWIPFLRYMV